MVTYIFANSISLSEYVLYDFLYRNMFCISLSEYVCMKTCSFLVPPSRDEINKSETVSGAPRMYIVFSPVCSSLPAK